MMTTGGFIIIMIFAVSYAATILYFINRKDPNIETIKINPILENKDIYVEIKFPEQKEILTETGLKIQFGEKYFHITKGGNYMSEITIDNILIESLRKDIRSND